MTLGDIYGNAVKLVKANSPEILTAMGVAGVITTSYLSARAGFTAAQVLQNTDVPTDRKERMKEQARQTWRLYIPPVASGSMAIVCIIMGSRAQNRRAAAAMTAYSLTEHAFSEYREKVVEQIGKNKEQTIRDDIAQKKVSETKEGAMVVVAGTGQVLCCELYTGRYFRADMEKLRRALNDINAKICRDVYVTLDEFYDLVGLPWTSMSSQMGWDSNKLLELQFSTVLAEGGEPCLAFEYSYVKPLK